MSETQTLPLTDFLLARIAEDRVRRYRLFPRYQRQWLVGVECATEIAARWTAVGEPGGETWLRRLARHWKRHPDYREEWA